jgi:hypothetical protein
MLAVGCNPAAITMGLCTGLSGGGLVDFPFFDPRHFPIYPPITQFRKIL